jgi:hypothetical protein
MKPAMGGNVWFFRVKANVVHLLCKKFFVMLSQAKYFVFETSAKFYIVILSAAKDLVFTANYEILRWLGFLGMTREIIFAKLIVLK